MYFGVFVIILVEINVEGVPLEMCKNSIRDTRTPQPREIVFNTMRLSSTEIVQRLRYFQSSVSYIKAQKCLSRQNNV